eukprot:scaffold20210_cov113-Isochrysis_galbana.AAC.6
MSAITHARACGISFSLFLSFMVAIFRLSQRWLHPLRRAWPRTRLGIRWSIAGSWSIYPDNGVNGH